MNKLFWITVTTIFLMSCEQEYIPVNPGEGPKYVVEGYIEAGEDPTPPFIILTRTFDFYNEIGPDQFNAAFVHDADVRVDDGSIEVQFQEVCFSELDPAVREEVAAQFGFDADSLMIDFCVYVDLLGLLDTQIGKRYDLTIRVGEDLITSTTTIPEHVPLENLYFAPPPGEPNDTLAQLRCTVSDPPGERNFYRYFGSTNGGPLGTFFSSVEEDLFFDGKSFEFQLFNPDADEEGTEPGEFGLYVIGDSITVKWCSLDEAHFDFWNTLEFGNANEGPFAGYTRLQTNINGGLGVWGGYSVSYYTLLVEY
jgi:hypothetical protein